jgi:hypothetical protein
MVPSHTQRHNKHDPQPTTATSHHNLPHITTLPTTQSSSPIITNTTTTTDSNFRFPPMPTASTMNYEHGTPTMHTLPHNPTQYSMHQWKFISPPNPRKLRNGAATCICYSLHHLPYTKDQYLPSRTANPTHTNCLACTYVRNYIGIHPLDSLTNKIHIRPKQ